MEEWGTIDSLSNRSEHFGFSYAGYACRVHLCATYEHFAPMIGPADRKRNDPKKDCLKLITARK